MGEPKIPFLVVLEHVNSGPDAAVYRPRSFFAPKPHGNSSYAGYFPPLINCRVPVAVGQNLFRTSNLIGACWTEALLFQIWGSLLVLFELGLSIVF